MLAGDFNDFPPGPVTRTLANRLADVGARIAGARAPFRRGGRSCGSIASTRSRAVGVGARRGGALAAVARAASDHLPSSSICGGEACRR